MNFSNLAESRKYPGYFVKGTAEALKTAEKDLPSLTDDLEEKKKHFESIVNAGFVPGDREFDNAKFAVSVAEGKIAEADKVLLTPDTYANESQQSAEYIPDPIGFALNQNGDAVIEANRVRVPADVPNNTVCAEIVAEGEESGAKELTAELMVIKTEDADKVIFSDRLIVNESVYNDAPEEIETALAHVHEVNLTNAENKKALEIMIGAKSEPLVMDPVDLNAVINANLCGSAKRNAVIITNKNGFAKLDADVNGVPIVTRDPEGNFIYKHKYMIQELPDEILPNVEGKGAPIVIGDMKVIKFFTVRNDKVVTGANTWNRVAIADRQIREEIITLATNSDEIYIAGYMA